MSRLLPGGLAGRLILLLLLALVASQAISLVIFSSERREAVRAAQREAVFLRTASLIRLLQETPPALHPRIVATASSPRLRFRLDDGPLLDDGPGNRAGRRLSAILAESLGASLRAPPRVRLETRGPSEKHWRHRRDDDGRRGPPQPPLIELAMSAPLASGGWLNVETRFEAPPEGWAWPTITAMALMAAAIMVIVAFSVRRITRPLRALEQAADRLGRGEDTAPLPETGPRELRRTTAAFNAMQDRLNRFVADRTRLLAAISHDLRTPITTLRLRAEFVDDPETRERILATLDEMQRLTEATLAFARDEAAAEDTRTIDLAAFASGLADDLAEIGWDVTSEDAPSLPVRCRPLALRRAVRNLIENAVRYGERARVAAVATPRGPVLRVDDDGPGIPEDKLEAVMEPFARLEESRSQMTGGVGLGLAIARSVARAHGGDLVLANRDGGGLRAELRLPAADPPQPS